MPAARRGGDSRAAIRRFTLLIEAFQPSGGARSVAPQATAPGKKNENPGEFRSPLTTLDGCLVRTHLFVGLLRPAAGTVRRRAASVAGLELSSWMRALALQGKRGGWVRNEEARRNQEGRGPAAR